MMEATKEFIRIVDDFVLINRGLNYHSPNDQVELQFERLKAWVKLIPKVLMELREVEADGRCVTKFEAMVYSGDPNIRRANRICDYWLECKAELRQTMLLQPTVKPSSKKTSRAQPEHEVTKYVRRNARHHDYNISATVRRFMEVENIGEAYFKAYRSYVDHDFRKKPLKRPQKKP